MSALDKATESFGADLPDWIEALAKECDRTSQNKAAHRLGYSAGAISSVLRGAYRADTRGIEETVRGALMTETVACPVLGDIGKDRCRRWRKAARIFRNGNAQDVTMYRACHRCPIFLQEASS